MNSFVHYLWLGFFVAFLSACGTLAQKTHEEPESLLVKDDKPSEDIELNLTSEDIELISQDIELNLIEEINKLDKRLSQRLDNLEKLIKTNHQAAKKKPAKKIIKLASKKAPVKKVKSKKPSQSNKIIVGEAEWIYLHTLDQSLKSRVDSGATTSSITASNIQPFERDGKNWVKFDVMHHASDTKATIEAPVVRKVRIRQASLDDFERRFVVSLDISLGDSLKQKAEFTLADRSEMKFPILLGREFLQDITLIDVGKKFLHPKYNSEAK